MSLFGHQPKSTVTRLNGIQLQSSSYGLGLPIWYGTNRGSGNLLWYGNFKATPHSQKTSGGKGLFSPSSKTDSYTYSAAVMMGLGEGGIVGIGRVWKGKDLTTLSALGLTLFAGTSGQAPWSFLTGYNVSGNWAAEVAFGYPSNPAFTNQALGYDTTAYLAASAYDLGTDATIPNHGFEIIGRLISGAGSGQDVNPRDFVVDFLTSQQYGVGFSSGWIGDTTLYSTYCLAAGILISPSIVDTQPAAQYLGDILGATNTDALWSEGMLKLLPRGDQVLVGNGQTYTPDLTPIYDLGDGDFLEDPDGPVRVKRTTPADAFNEVRIEFNNRANGYNPEVTGQPDQDAVEQFGLRQAPVTSMHFITEMAVAKTVAQILVQRSVYVRNTYTFGLTKRFALLEPGDYVTVTDLSPDMQLSRVLVRITEIGEAEEGYSITAEEIPIGTASAALYPHDSGLRYLQDYNSPPLSVSAPYIFELPGDPSTTGLAIGIATGAQSGDFLYGGCNVWVSTDGTSYQQVGTINGSSRYGSLTGSLASGGATLAVALAAGGQLVSVTSTEAAAGATLVSVGQEYLSYTTATLTGTSAYSLTGLYRGFFDTTPALHSSGARFARIDDAICRVQDIDLSLIGRTLHFKLTAFNKYHGGEQALADATEYTYTVTGYMQALSTLAQLMKIGDDGWVTGAEKQIVIRDYTDATNEKSGIDAKADAVSISRVAYDNAYAALTAYLGGLSPAWNDTTQATPVVRATWNSEWTTFEDARRALLLAIQGLPGVSGAQVLIYRRSASTPALPTATTTYTFATGALTGLDNGWTRAIPAADGNPLFVSAASASSTGPTDTIAPGEWASPIIESQDGSDGAHGINTATVWLFQRATSAPAVPSGTTTWTFATGILSGTLGSWSQTIPSGTNPIWAITATALGTGATDTIATGEWATPVIQAKNGADGNDGSPGSPGSPGAPSINLDVTKASIAVSADFTGAVKSGQLPISNKATLLSGTTDVTTSATLSISGSGATATIDSSGNISLTGVTTLTGSVTVTAVYGGVTYTRAFATVRNDDPQPPATSTSISDNGTTTVDSSTLFSVPTSGIWTVAANGSGQIIFDMGASAFWSASSGTKSFTLGAGCRYRVAGSGGSWTTIGAGELSDGETAIPGEPASISLSLSGYTQTGLTAGGDYEVAFFSEKQAGTQSSITMRWSFTARQT